MKLKHVYAVGFSSSQKNQGQAFEDILTTKHTKVIH